MISVLIISKRYTVHEEKRKLYKYSKIFSLPKIRFNKIMQNSGLIIIYIFAKKAPKINFAHIKCVKG